MKCPACEGNDDKVIDSRPAEDGSSIRRRRECLICGSRFTTYERVEEMPLMVIKKDGSRQPFDRQKLIIGIMKSCEKRPITTEQIEHLIDNIERTASNALRREISTAEIGEQVLKQLRTIDEVAYVRFASVYRAFSDINSFVSEISALTVGDEQLTATMSSEDSNCAECGSNSESDENG